MQATAIYLSYGALIISRVSYTALANGAGLRLRKWNRNKAVEPDKHDLREFAKSAKDGSSGD
jgi:hypothetical protein